MNILRSFRNGLYLGCYMSGTGEAPSGNNTPLQTSASVSTNGEVKPLGGTMQVTPGQEPKDISSTGAAQQPPVTPGAEAPKAPTQADIDAALAAQKGVQPERNPDGTFKAAPKEAAPADPNTPNPDAVPEGSKTGLTNKQISEAKANAEASDKRFVPYVESFMVNGDLTAEQTAQAAKDFGVSESIVKAWVEGQKATMELSKTAGAVDQLAADQTVASIKSLVGTEADYDQFKNWANSNYQDMDALVAAINTNNPALYKMAMGNAIAAWKANGGAGGPRDLTNGAQNTGVQAGPQGFASLQEQSNAINDPKYRSDPAYRKMVEARIAVSRF